MCASTTHVVILLFVMGCRVGEVCASTTHVVILLFVMGCRVGGGVCFHYTSSHLAIRNGL